MRETCRSVVVGAGATEHPVGLFRADRPALTDPGHRSTTRLSASR